MVCGVARRGKLAGLNWVHERNFGEGLRSGKAFAEEMNSRIDGWVQLFEKCMSLDSTDSLILTPSMMALNAEHDPFLELRLRAREIEDSEQPERRQVALKEMLQVVRRGSEAQAMKGLELLSQQDPARITQAVGDLIVLLSHSSEAIRARSARLLGRLGAPARIAVPALFEALSDSSRFVRSEVGQALRMLGCN